MIELNNHPLFETVKGSSPGVTLYLLKNLAAPVQQGFYFVNDGMDEKGRYLWFYCAFPPSPGHSLGLVDFASEQIRHFPETVFNAGPFVDPATGNVHWGSGPHLWRRGPEPENTTIQLNSLEVDGRPANVGGGHLTRSADGKNLFVETRLAMQKIFGTLPLDGGPFEPWYSFNRCHNHSQFSPTDPELVLIAQEIHTDPLTGLKYPITDRMWLLRKGEKPRPVLKTPRGVSHESWDADGRHVWSIGGCGLPEAWRTDIVSGEVERIVFPDHVWHVHSSADNRYTVADSIPGFGRMKGINFYRGCASAVYFLNRETDKSVKLADNPARHDFIGKNYHIDPHPRFCSKDRYVVFTTTIKGEVQVAIVPVNELVNVTS